MKKTLFILALIPFISTAGEYETTIGIGHQYGGIIGAQLGYKTTSTKYYAAIGAVGFALGAQTTFSDEKKHTYGFVVGKESIQAEDGFMFLTYDYHHNGFENNGFVMGAGFGFTRADEYHWFADRGEIETTPFITLNFGYKF
ncbi:hypothetical protein Q4493_14800 [Colwellia sp. 1_MG-2023]|uniref:hypothetical protein n=1 Tax=Colwellia sp. 1_MG-2023 TaxID=3062649 RepID=UPI0026E2C2AC|nr:hypothetical protein [Colwellia sp. 1_MG-2023]MDO6447037.1 hypothetical protein [Colwellia sp. 1_MG-2023]